MAFDLTRDIVLRWDDQDPAIAPILGEGAIDVVLVRDPSPSFGEACQAAGIRVAPAEELKVLDLAGYRNAGTAPAALADGLWPGITGSAYMADDEEVASPSRMPWVDANGFRYAWLKALCPGRPPVLAYLPNEAAGLKPDRVVPYDTLELALVEAWLSGGNYVLALEPRYRTALIQRDPKALTAWRRFGRTARWLKQHRAVLGRPVFPQITLLVDAGEATAEIANLMLRHNASPALESAESAPPPDPARRIVIVAASLEEVSSGVRDRILAHADAGSMVVTDRGEGEPWWRVAQLQLVRDRTDREFYRLGRGTVVAYKKIIGDPNDFALDVIDLATHARRAVRTWFAPTVIATVTSGSESGALRGRAIIQTINYGSPLGWELMMYVQGNYGRARLLRPEAEPLELKTAKRGSQTEVTVPELRRAGVVILD